MMQQRMTRWLLTLVALMVGCRDAEPQRRGPALTPLVANQLKAFAPECEVRTAEGKTGSKELRLCRGRQSMMTIHLDDKRHLIEIEVGVWAPMRAEAQQMIEQSVRGLISEPAIAAMTARMGNSKADPVVVDGVRVNAFYTQAPNENPRYTVTLAWP
jgi:hypothetical protein